MFLLIMFLSRTFTEEQLFPPFSRPPQIELFQINFTALPPPPPSRIWFSLLFFYRDNFHPLSYPLFSLPLSSFLSPAAEEEEEEEEEVSHLLHGSPTKFRAAI